ncbi:hypothetical protein PLICRDRAFT_177361 [Plicaturopsis crispa FD-325 SS-3]|nr:hypothetical protein PLICRDRAFT_177361 [Plicaturopsis crispa FD-325 SS-3]
MTTSFNTDYTTGTNQGIVDGRPVGQQPPKSVTLDQDNFLDPDASASAPVRTSASDTLTGATSQDVYASSGQPSNTQTSQEVHHDGQPGRKRHAEGIDQWGPPGTKETELSRAERDTA